MPAGSNAASPTMDEAQHIAFAVVIITIIILVMLATMSVLMVVNANRRVKHNAEMARLAQQREREVMHAQREAVEQTLNEVGRELHDNVLQLLGVAQIGLNTVLEGGPDRSRLILSRDALEQGVAEVRRMSHDLNAELWQQRSLADAISVEADRVQRVARVQVHLLVDQPPTTLPPDANTILFRVFQVILTNALKHSGADRIDITLGARNGPILSISDNGIGFDTKTTKHNAGYVNIHERCRLIGYEATCETQPGGGCTWHITPLNDHVV